MSEEQKPKFEVGDLAWSPKDNFQLIEKFRKGFTSDTYSFLHGRSSYTAEGFHHYEDKHPTLLTVEEAAKLGYFPPKKKVVKTIEIWTNVYPNGRTTHKNEENANIAATPHRIACVKLTGTYEVEE